jgi:gliding motility-associated-like protein
VFISIDSVNLAPVAVDDTANTKRDVAIDIDVRANDFDPDGILSNPVVIASPAHGTATVNTDGTIQYTPSTGYTGYDTLMYRVCDNGSPSLCDSAFVFITVDSVNHAPVAVNDTFTIAENTSLEFDVLLNDTDSDGDILTASVLVGPASGTVQPLSNGAWLYTPDHDFYGTETFTYIVCDDGSPSLCDTGVVVIKVTPSGDLSLSIPDAFSPNGDGINDVFMIRNIERYPNNRLTIVNRWGDVVYQELEYKNNWDGNASAGGVARTETLPAGTYYYIFEPGHGEKPMSGYVYLNR